MAANKQASSIEIVGCKILTIGLKPSDKEKVAKIYVTLIQSGATQLVHPTAGKKLFEIDPSFSYSWAFFNEKINNVPKDCKLIVELRLLDHKTEKEIKYASCVVASSALSEDAVYFDLTDTEGRRADGAAASVGVKIISASKLQLMKLVPERFESIGRLRAVVWRGRKISSTYPVYLTIGLAVAGTEKHKSAVVNVPRDPIFDHVADMDVCSMQGDLVIALWEVHNVRSHKQLGQIIFPLSWLANNSTQSSCGTKASLTGWFQFLPLNKATAYNNGGQYRPYIPGTPTFTGFGLDEPEKDKCIGFLRVQLSVVLKNPLFRSLFFQPSLYGHETAEVEVIDDDSVMTIVASMIVAKNNLMQIYNRLRYPMWLITFFDIVRWREHPLFTFITIYFWTYFVLVAPTWQFPIIGCLFFIFIGFATSRRRNFNSSHLYIPEMDVDTSEESTLREKYNKLKSAAYTVASLVDSTRVALERLGNIFTWADPMLTLATIVLLLGFCVSFSLVLFIFPPHDFIFCAGMMAFVPEDFMDYSIAVSKEYEKVIKKYIKSRKSATGKKGKSKDTAESIDGSEHSTVQISVSATSKIGVSSVQSATTTTAAADSQTVEGGGETPRTASKGNIFMHTAGSVVRRRASVAFGAISSNSGGSTTPDTLAATLLTSDLAPAGHVRSSFLLSQYWEKGTSGRSGKTGDTGPDAGPQSPLSRKHSTSIGSDSDIKVEAPSIGGSPEGSLTGSSKSWSSRWCEVWKAPPALAVTSKSNGQNIYISLEGAVAHFIGGVFMSKSQRRDSTGSSRLSMDSDLETITSSQQESASADSTISPKKELFGFRRKVKAVMANRSGEARLSESALKSVPENDESMRGSLASGGGSCIKESAYKEIFCFSICQKDKNSSIEGSGFEMVFACSSQDEALGWVSNINSISGVGNKPAVVESKAIIERSNSKTLDSGAVRERVESEADSDDDEAETSESMRRKFQAYMLNWLSLAPDDMELAHRHFCRSLQYSGTLDHSSNKTLVRTAFLNSPSVFPSSGDVVAGDLEAVGSREPGEPYIAVTLLSARNLPFGADHSSNFEIVSGLYYMYCDLWVTPYKSRRLRSSKQPSGEHPVFRDELSFPLPSMAEASDEKSNIFKSKSLPALPAPKTVSEILAAVNKITVHCGVYNHKPLSFGDDDSIGTAAVCLKNLGFTSAPSEPVYDWFPLLGSKGEQLGNAAAVRLKIQLLN